MTVVTTAEALEPSTSSGGSGSRWQSLARVLARALGGAGVQAGVLIAASLLLVALVASRDDGFQIVLLTQIGIMAIAVTGLNLFMGYAGQVSFGHTAYLGIGAYSAAYLTTTHSWHPLAAMVSGTAISGAVAAAVGYPSLRLAGHYLALATFAVGLGFYSLVNSSPLFNGFAGIPGVPAFTVGSWQADTPTEKLWLVWAFVIAVTILCWRMRTHRFGRALATVASSEVIATSAGIASHRLKLVVFVISAMITSSAGALYAFVISYVSPETFSFAAILQMFMILFVGGVGTLWGPTIGAVVIVGLPQVVDLDPNWQPSIFAAGLIVLLVLRPQGLMAFSFGAGSHRAR